MELLGRLGKCNLEALDSFAWTSYDLHISLAISAKAMVSNVDSQVLVMNKGMSTGGLVKPSEGGSSVATDRCLPPAAMLGRSALELQIKVLHFSIE